MRNVPVSVCEEITLSLRFNASNYVVFQVPSNSTPRFFAFLVKYKKTLSNTYKRNVYFLITVFFKFSSESIHFSLYCLLSVNDWMRGPEIIKIKRKKYVFFLNWHKISIQHKLCRALLFGEIIKHGIGLSFSAFRNFCLFGRLIDICWCVCYHWNPSRAGEKTERREMGWLINWWSWFTIWLCWNRDPEPETK